jgi:predicted Zn-dependent peptidase
MWHKMRALAYQVHPYQWLTIGKELSHIEQVQLEEVKAFFFKHYRPVNAIVVVAGNVQTAEIQRLAEKWFGDIPMGEKYIRQLPAEPVQTAARSLEVKADVPLDALMKTWHMPGRLQQGYYVADLITEILGGGSSSRLYQSLVKEQQLFSDIQCYQLGTIDPGLLTIQGKLVKGVAMEKAEAAVNAVIQQLVAEPVTEVELMKIKNRTESVIVFEDMALMNRANSLAYYELLGDAALINEELNRFHAVTIQDIQQGAATIFTANNVNTLYYYSKTL